jgi:adenine-specific DNA-methyltransferase
MSAKKYDDLSKEELVRLLESRDRRDATRFGLVWEANEIERDKALNQDFVALDLDQSLSCGPAPWRNLIIEGDNFDALRYLRMTFAGQVKCIYIDPPYNTGNKDFIYNDQFVDKEDLWRHSKWCEFMFQRLTLAKDLLRQDGVIFVSIDDNEMASLSLIMKQIFGESNFVATFIWKRRTSPDSRNLNGISGDHEYVVTFRGGSAFRVAGRAKDMTKYSNPDNDALGPWMSDNLTGLANAKQRPNLHYDIVHPETGVRYPPHASRGWIYGPDRMNELITTGRILWPKKETGRPRLKRYITDMQSSTTGYSTLLAAPGNVEATKELGNLLDAKVFTFPKPSGLILELLSQCTSKDDLILDFFAGSGTTAHAVHKLNGEDGGTRRVILASSTEVTADEPQKNLCRDVCATRVRRAIEGYKDAAPLGGDFAYLRCRRIPNGKLMDIDHEQVWTALQLTHCTTIQPLGERAVIHADNDDQRLIYVPHFRAKDGRALVKAVREKPGVIVYTWQPALVRQRLQNEENVQVEPVPESLARRFGLRV